MNKLAKSPLREHIDFLTGFPFKSHGYSENSMDIRLMCGDNIGQGSTRWSTVKRWPAADVDNYDQYLLEENDVVLAMDRPWIDAGLKYASVSSDDLPSLLLQRTARLRGSSTLDVHYLKYIIGSPWFTEYVKRINTGSLVPHISGDQIKDFSFPVPTVEHQKQVVRVLRAIDQKIELNNKVNAELDAMARLIYDYWFVQFDFPDADGNPYKSSGGKMVYNEELKREIPDGWGVDQISSVLEVKDGTHDSPKPAVSDVYLITSKSLKPEGLDFDNAYTISSDDYISINKRSGVDTGDVLFSMIGSIGVVYKVDEENINFAIKNIALYKLSDKPEYGNYVYISLKSYDMQRYMASVIAGSIQKFIDLGALRSMPILLNDQYILEFSEKTKSLFERLTLIKRENQKLVELRDWLLPMLMNGQVTVKDSQ